MSFSVLILTYNEEKNINKLLNVISKFSDDIIILDSHSTDKTLKIAKQYNCIIHKRKFDDEKSHRTFSLNLSFKYDWVYNPDADEVPDNLLIDEMVSIASKKSKFSAFEVRFKNFYNNKWLKYSTDYPVYVIRFFKPKKIKFQRKINLKYLIDGKVGILKGHFYHYPFAKGLEWWISKHNLYSSRESHEMLEIKKNKNLIQIIIELFKESNSKNKRILVKEISFFLPFRAFLRFFYTFFFRLGFLDGINGFRYSLLISFYEYLIHLKFLEKSNDNS